MNFDMDYVQFFTLMITFLTGFGFLYREMKQIERDIKDETKNQSARIDKAYERTDKLYEMFIDLLKQRNG